MAFGGALVDMSYLLDPEKYTGMRTDIPIHDIMKEIVILRKEIENLKMQLKTHAHPGPIPVCDCPKQETTGSSFVLKI